MKKISLKKTGKALGIFLTPVLFSAIICAAFLLVLNLGFGDVLGYASILLKNPASSEDETPELLLADEDKGDTIHISEVNFPVFGQVYGEISIPDVGILCPLIYGDSDEILDQGAGQFVGSNIIGYSGTTMACAHINRHFKTLHLVVPGNTIQVRTEYGVYTYEVKYVGVHKDNDNTVYDLGRKDENLVLYTCYFQQTAVGSVKMRFFVCADYVSGPLIVDGGSK
jgi:sortase A